MNGLAPIAWREFALTCLMLAAFSLHTESLADDYRHERIYRLPAEIAQGLRAHNSPDQRGGCAESNIFIHAYHELEQPDRGLWFLGAPDYLCKTNSFISVILDSGGNWAFGRSAEKGWSNSNLNGVPVLFRYVRNLGFFLISEWQVEGPINFMYFSADGITWTSQSLPAGRSKNTEYDCCDAPYIGSLCVDESGFVYISHKDSESFEATIWGSPITSAFPGIVSWSQFPDLPDATKCDSERDWPRDFFSSGMHETKRVGRSMIVSPGWAVIVPW